MDTFNIILNISTYTYTANNWVGKESYVNKVEGVSQQVDQVKQIILTVRSK
jgi:hypothetical protein